MTTKTPKFSINKNNIIGLALIDLIIVLDQLSKWLTMEFILRKENGLNIINWFTQGKSIMGTSFEEFQTQALTSFLNFVMVFNKGVSFGMFNSGEISTTYILIAMTSLLTIGLFLWLLKSNSKALSISLALIIGGAIGNLIDRIRLGAVVDFIDFYIDKYHWPAFNIADSCIAIGACIMLFITLKENEEKIDEKSK